MTTPWRRVCLAISLSTLFLCTTDYAAVNDPSQDASNVLLKFVEQSNAHLGSEGDYLAEIQRQLDSATAHLRGVDYHVHQLQNTMDAERQAVIPLLQFQYEHGSPVFLWLSLLFSASDWKTLQSGAADLSEILHHREVSLEKFATDVRQYQTLKNEGLSTVEDLQLANENISAEKHMYEVAEQAAGVNAAPASTMSTLTSMLQSAWADSISPQIGLTLTELDKAVEHLSDALPPSNLQLSFTHAQATIPQDVLNRVIQQYPALRHVEFLFRPNHLLLSAQANGQQILIVGHLHVEEEGARADYVIDEVAVDGILVPPIKAQSWFQKYAFYIDVTRISKHVRIHSIRLDNQILHLELNAKL
jgi:hypothetical protein